VKLTPHESDRNDPSCNCTGLPLVCIFSYSEKTRRTLAHYKKRIHDDAHRYASFSSDALTLRQYQKQQQTERNKRQQTRPDHLYRPPTCIVSHSTNDRASFTVSIKSVPSTRPHFLCTHAAG